MNILDENIDVCQRERLKVLKVHFRQAGVELGRRGMNDREQIIPLRHTLRRPTFFTRDHDFYHPTLRHRGYSLVYLDVARTEAAEFIRRFLRHRAFRTQAQRRGKVIRVRHRGITYWQVNQAGEHVLRW